jgi:D-alanyl-D-alanine carboxypeptidase
VPVLGIDAHRESIQARVAARMVREHWPGVAVGIEHRSVVHFCTLGLADLEHGTAVRGNTVFRIGSVTKQFTALLVLKLQEMGKLSLDHDVTRYVPESPTHGRRVTLHQLLSHTGGLPNFSQLPGYLERAREDRPHEAILELIRDRPLRFEPGSSYEYSNTGYYLLGMVIEAVHGGPYRRALREFACKPLNLARTRYLDAAPIVPDRAAGYVRGGDRWFNAPYLSMSGPFAAGGISSTVEDLLAWQRGLNEGGLCSRSNLNRMRTPSALSSSESTSYGYGVAVARFEDTPKITHAGGINGFASVLSTYPAHDLTIAVLVNLGGARPWALDSELARLVLERPAAETKPVALSVSELELYAGEYASGGPAGQIEVEADGLSWFGQHFIPAGSHRFVAKHDPESVLVFRVGPSGVEHAVSIREGIETALVPITADGCAEHL